jgi:hypothetical protein
MWLSELAREGACGEIEKLTLSLLKDKKAAGLETRLAKTLASAKTDDKKILMSELAEHVNHTDVTRALFEMYFKRDESDSVKKAVLDGLCSRYSSRRDIRPIFNDILAFLEKDEHTKAIEQILLNAGDGCDALCLEAVKKTKVRDARTRLLFVLMRRYDWDAREAIADYLKKEILPNAAEYPAITLGVWLVALRDLKHQKGVWAREVDIENAPLPAREGVVRLLSKGFQKEYSEFGITRGNFLDRMYKMRALYRFLKNEEKRGNAEYRSLVKEALYACFPSGVGPETIFYSNKNLDSTSCVDTYGIGGGAAGAFGCRWGRSPLCQGPNWRKPKFTHYTEYNK